MKDAGAVTNGTAQSAKPNQLSTISERKLEANRENAKKSTGPKTPRGKAYSRRNALKHGLFAEQLKELQLRGYAHFRTMDWRGNVRRIGVAVANKSFTIAGLKDCGFECPSCCPWVGKFSNALYLYSRALPPLSNS